MRQDFFLGKLAVASAMVLAVACGDDGGDDGDTPMEDGGVDAGDTPMLDGGTDAGPAPEDGNDGFEDAVALTLGTPRSDTIDFSGDADWFSFSAAANQWILVRITNTTPASPDQALPDVAAIVYDADEEVFAANTDGVTGSSAAAELRMRMPSAGTWYVQFAPQNASVGTYEILVADSAPRPGVLENDERGDDAASATEIDALPVTLVGEFDDATDVDVFSFSIDSTEPVRVGAGFHVGGRSQVTEAGTITLASGSTASPAVTWVTTAADPATVIARFDEGDYENGAPFGRTVRPSLPAGDYLLWVRSDGEDPGANAYYFGRLEAFAEFPLEAEDETNDLATTPEPIALTPATGISRGFLTAFLGADDVDHYSVTTTGTLQPYAVCSSRTDGSGVVGLDVSILTTAGAIVMGCGEANDEACSFVEDLADGGGTRSLFPSGQTAGTYVVRLRKTGQVSDVTGTWVRCFIGGINQG